MKKLLLILILALLFFPSCKYFKGDKGDEGPKGGWDDAKTDTPLVNTSNPTGFAEAGPFQGYSEVTMWPLNAEYSQIGDPYVGDTRADDSGKFTIYAVITSPNVKTKVKGEAFNETSGGFDVNVVMESTIPGSAESFNANYATSIVSIVGNYWYHEDIEGVYYQNQLAFSAAETAVMNYFDYSESWPETVKKSYEMTLTGDTSDDAKLVFINSTISLGRTGPQQGNYMRQIAEDIYTGADVLKPSVNNETAGLKIKTIKDNLDNYYLSRGLPYKTAPFWELPGLPDYYELLGREQAVQGSFNLEDTAGCNCDAPYKRYAIPHILQSWFETSRFLASNFGEGKSVSIWSRGVHGGGYDAPGIRLLDVSELREKLLDSSLGFHGLMGAHGLSAGDEVYFVIESETAFVLSVGCDGGALPWGRKIASNDGGLTYIGWNNVTAFFTKSGLKLSGVN